MLRGTGGGLKRNVVFAIGQSIGVLFAGIIAYRIVITYAGLERFGVWSLLMAGSTLARVTDLSGAGSLARFVAMASRNEESNSASDVIHTVILTSLCFNVFIGLSAWAVLFFSVPYFVQATYVPEARTLIPFVATSLILNPLAGAIASAIDGTQRADHRAIVVTLAAAVFLIATLLLVPGLGVVGYGLAQIFQQCIVMLLGWWLLRRHVANLGWLPHRWRRRVFNETAAYALKLNGISVVAIFFEPLAKFAFNGVGGPGSVALYELASRLVVQLRGLVMAAATPLIPAFAARPNNKDNLFRTTLIKSTEISAWAAIGVALATLLSAPLVSLLVLKGLSKDFLQMNAALTAGWALNVIAVPLYLAAQSRGILRWNFLSQLMIAISVLCAIVFLEPTFGRGGLVAGIVLGLVLSMVIAVTANSFALEVNDAVWNSKWRLAMAVLLITTLCIVGYFLSTRWAT